MKTSINTSDFDKQLYDAIKDEEGAMNNNRVDQIMDKVMELHLQASFESQELNFKTAVVYAISIAISINIGCIIGNMFEFATVSHSAGVELISIGIGYGSIFLTV